MAETDEIYARGRQFGAELSMLANGLSHPFDLHRRTFVIDRGCRSIPILLDGRVLDRFGLVT